MKLEECRKNINRIDGLIIELLNRRAAESTKIGMLKMRAGLPVIDLQREMEIIRRITRGNDGPMPNESLSLIYRQILLESRKLQSEIAEQFAAVRATE